MGYTSALDMAQFANSIDAALYWHLQSNHYPPLPSSLVGPAKRAIAKANLGEWDAKVSLRDTEVRHNKYGKLVPVPVLIESLHLEAFLEPDPDSY